MDRDKIQRAAQILRKPSLNRDDAEFLETLTPEELDTASPPIEKEPPSIINIDTAALIKERLKPGETMADFNNRVESQKEAIRKAEDDRLAEIQNRGTAENWVNARLSKNKSMLYYVMCKVPSIPAPSVNTALCGKTGTGKTTELYAALLKTCQTHALDVEGQRISYANKPRVLFLPWRGSMQDRLFWQPDEYHKELAPYFETFFSWVFIDDLFITDFADPVAKSYFVRFIGQQWELGAKFYYTCNATSMDSLVKLFGDITLYDRMKPEVFDFVRFSGKSLRGGGK